MPATTWSQPNRECVGVAPMWSQDNVPDIPNASGASAGTPGAWTPPDGTLPTNAAQAASWGVTASPTTAWTVGQYVQGSTAGAGGEMYWNGTTWLGGRVPAAEV